MFVAGIADDSSRRLQASGRLGSLPYVQQVWIDGPLNKSAEMLKPSMNPAKLGEIGRSTRHSAESGALDDLCKFGGGEGAEVLHPVKYTTAIGAYHLA